MRYKIADIDIYKIKNIFTNDIFLHKDGGKGVLHRRHGKSVIVDCDQDESIPIDCSYFVYLAMLLNGYAVKYFDTKNFEYETAGLLTYYDKRPNAKDTQPGDVVSFDGHVGIVEDYNPKRKTGTYIGAQNKHIHSETFSTDGLGFWGGTYKYLGAFEPMMTTYNRGRADEKLEEFLNCYNIRRAREDRKHQQAD